MHLLQSLNPSQQEAVKHTDGPVLVLAGPGSGKTRVLTYRIAYLIQEMGIAPFHILAVTFTNKAAREMNERLKELVGEEAAYALTVGTFHTTCARFLRHDIEHIGRNRDFAIFDSEDQQRLMQRILRDFHLDDQKYTPRSILGSISAAKNQLLSPETCLKHKTHPTRRDTVVKDCYMRYQELLRESNALDFDDLLLATLRVFEDHPDVLEYYHNRYHYLLVDEYQDTNMPQYLIVRHLAAKHRNLFVIGDDDQSIYSWRGADIRNILEFSKDYPEARIFTLEQNYRSTQVILDVAQAIIHTGTHNKKHLWTEQDGGNKVAKWEGFKPDDEARLIAEEIARLVNKEGYKPGDCAIMYRINAQSRVLEEALLEWGIPYQVVGGIRFYERKEIKDLLAYLRLLHNPSDSVSMERVINIPPRGIGERTLNQLAHAASDNGISIYHMLRLLESNKVFAEGQELPPDQANYDPSRYDLPTFTARITNALLGFLHMIHDFMYQQPQLNLVGSIDMLLNRLEYREWIQKSYSEDEATERWANIQELRTVAWEYCWMSQDAQLSTFLEEVSLITDMDRLNTQNDAVTCITLHQSKGLEFPVVFLPGVEEGMLPHSRSLSERDKELLQQKIEEERRLLYVGVTRAKERLYLLHAFQRITYGRVDQVSPSRFLANIPPHLLNHRKREKAKSSSPQRDMFSPRSPYAAARSSLKQPQQQSSTPALQGMQRRVVARPLKPDQVPGTQFVPGQRVHHHRYGAGVVVRSIRLEQGDEEVLVNFDGEGERQLIASFAQLKKVDG